MKKIFLFLILVFGVPLMADNIQYVTLNNGYKVWTKRVGSGPIKILTLHGGPGCSHEYIETSFKDVFSPDEYEIIYYDQLGSYYSDKPDDESLWTVDRFCEEVEEVRKALGLAHFYLYGQSWGAMLAIEYALKYQRHLKGLILSNCPGSITSYETYINKLRSELPEEIQNKLSYYEDKGEFTHPDYHKIMVEEVYTYHLCRLKPWPEALDTMFKHFNAKVYQVMQGPNEFVIQGNFKNWDRWKDLSKIQTPTLAISGRYDTINPEDTLKIASLLPQGVAKICEKGSHLTQYDDPEPYFKELLHFLNSVENLKKL